MFFYSTQATIEEKSLLENFTIFDMKLTEKQDIFIHQQRIFIHKENFGIFLNLI